MADNYKMTAKRMGESSDTLHKAGQFYNACYIGGYVPECYSKILLGLLGVVYRPNHNTPALLTSAEQTYIASSSTIAGQLARSGTMASIQTAFANILAGWNPNMRYDDSHGWDEPTSNLYQQEVQTALQYIAKLEIDGLI